MTRTSTRRPGKPAVTPPAPQPSRWWTVAASVAVIIATVAHLAVLEQLAATGSAPLFFAVLAAPAVADVGLDRSSGRWKWWLGFAWLLWSTHPAFLALNFVAAEAAIGSLAAQSHLRRRSAERDAAA